MKNLSIVVLLFTFFIIAVSSDSVATEPYTVISDTTLLRIKRSVDVRLENQITEQQLHDIAKEIFRSGYDKTFILYYLPGMQVDSGAWATTHFNPKLKIRINDWMLDM